MVFIHMEIYQKMLREFLRELIDIQALFSFTKQRAPIVLVLYRLLHTWAPTTLLVLYLKALMLRDSLQDANDIPEKALFFIHETVFTWFHARQFVSFRSIALSRTRKIPVGPVQMYSRVFHT